MRLRLLLALLLAACGGAAVEESRPPPERTQPAGKTQRGQASWYGGSDGLNGTPTANGERYDQNAFTAAHRTLPFGTRVKVTNLKNNLSVVVRINDRGPFSKGRIIDLSRAAARAIRMIDDGVVPVVLEVLR